MFQNISWASYCLALAILLIAYYSVVISLYYSKDVLLLLRNIRKVHGNKEATNPFPEGLPDIQNQQPTLFTGISTGKVQQEPSPNEALKPMANALADEVKAYLEQRVGDGTSDELLIAFQQITSKYPTLKGTSYQTTINQLIAVASEDYCSVHLSAEQLSRVWL